MKTEPDFEELLKLFKDHDVHYCVIGAFAFGYHARPRYTKDLDILIEPEATNAKKIIEALKDFGFESLNLTVNDFCAENKVIQLGYEPVRVDLITSIQGVDFQQVWNNKVKGKYGKQEVYFIGLDDLIKTKEIARRGQDLVDLEILKEIQSKRMKRNE